MQKLASTNVSKIVAQNFKTARVFAAHGIDFCCNGGIPLEQACRQQSLDLQVIIDEVNEALTISETENFAGMPLDALVRHIENVHHNYVRNTLPPLNSFFIKLCQVHGDRHPELFDIKELLEHSAVDLTLHMAKEEQFLFPYIQAMVAALDGRFPLSQPHFGHLKNPITMMEQEHVAEGNRFRAIEHLSNGYTPPKDACQTYRVAFLMLKEFEMDLHKHIHLENNILFPKALEMYLQEFA